MNTAKNILVLALSLFLCSCAFFQPPLSEAEARRSEGNKAKIDDSMAISSRASYYEKKGMSKDEARAAAEAEYTKAK